MLANAAVGGTFAGVGTALGVGLGSVAASLAVAAAQAGSVPGQRSADAGRHAAPPAEAPSVPDEQSEAMGRHAADPAEAEQPQVHPPASDPWQAAAHEQPIAPQQAQPPDVDDFLPEPPDRKRDKKDDNPPAEG